MSAIDFPASPTTGTLFTAPGTGVTYLFNGTIWVTQAGPGGGTGDFMATNSGNISLGSSTFDALTLNTVYSGNASGSYSTSTGRYIPPAGRYYISAGFSSSNGTSVFQTRCAIYKNGVAVGTASGSPGSIVSVNAVGNFGNPTYEAIVDANGSDYFQIIGYGSPASTVIQAQTAWFSAFPLTGMQGPMGPPFGGGTGDFCATGTGGSLTSSVVTMIPATIATGNSGGYYNVANGRYTPPAGRYNIFGWVYAAATTASAVLVYLYKNGVIIPNVQNAASLAANSSGGPSVDAIVDANGSDYFELKGSSASAGATVTAVSFGAFPLTGMQGPQGDPGTPLAQNAQTGNYTLVLGDANGHLYHAVAAAAATYTIPANASVAYPIGTTLSFVNDSTNNVTVAITTDTLVLSPGTTTGSRTLATGGVATALKVTATRWLINGTGLT